MNDTCLPSSTAITSWDQFDMCTKFNTTATCPATCIMYDLSKYQQPSTTPVDPVTPVDNQTCVPPTTIPANMGCVAPSWDTTLCKFSCPTTCATPTTAAAPATLTCSDSFWNDQTCNWECKGTTEPKQCVKPAAVPSTLTCSAPYWDSFNCLYKCPVAMLC